MGSKHCPLSTSRPDARLSCFVYILEPTGLASLLPPLTHRPSSHHAAYQKDSAEHAAKHPKEDVTAIPVLLIGIRQGAAFIKRQSRWRGRRDAWLTDDMSGLRHLYQNGSSERNQQL